MQFRDFVPEPVAGKWYQSKKYESFEAAVLAAAAWVKESGITPLQIETVVLPSIHEPGETGTTDAALETTSEWSSWHQFLRIWY